MKGRRILMLLDGANNGDTNLWYLVHCQARKERYAAKSLNHLLKLRIFLPESRTHFPCEVRQEPFFPGYLFAFADLRMIPASSINTCPGVLRLVEFGGFPQSVPESVIGTIAQQLDRLNGENVFACHDFSPGDAVHMKCGPLQDLNMVFVGPTSPSKRVHVLLEILGRIKEMRVDVEMLEKNPGSVPLQTEWSPQRVRYTRGKGRRIHRWV